LSGISAIRMADRADSPAGQPTAAADLNEVGRKSRLDARCASHPGEPERSARCGAAGRVPLVARLGGAGDAGFRAIQLGRGDQAARLARATDTPIDEESGSARRWVWDWQPRWVSAPASAPGSGWARTLPQQTASRSGLGRDSQTEREEAPRTVSGWPRFHSRRGARRRERRGCDERGSNSWRLRLPNVRNDERLPAARPQVPLAGLRLRVVEPAGHPDPAPVRQRAADLGRRVDVQR